MKIQKPSFKILLNRSHVRTWRIQYAPHFFKVGGIIKLLSPIQKEATHKLGFNWTSRFTEEEWV